MQQLTYCMLILLVAGAYSQCLSKDDSKQFKNEAKTRLYKGQQIFTVNFLAALNRAVPNENLFFSPYSVYHALLLAYFGSKNQTEDGLKVKMSKQKIVNASAII